MDNVIGERGTWHDNPIIGCFNQWQHKLELKEFKSMDNVIGERGTWHENPIIGCFNQWQHKLELKEFKSLPLIEA
jgi:hypothetical protein